MKFDIYWSPEGRKIATVEAKSEKDALKQAPLPYKKYRGELYAVATPNAFMAVITIESEGLLLGGTRHHSSSPFASRSDAEAFATQAIEVNRNRPGYKDAKIFAEIVPVHSARPIPASTKVPR